MIADEDQKSVLLRLHDQIDEARAEISGQEIAASFKPAIDPLAVVHALDELVRSGLAISVGRTPSRYRISRAGIAEIERDFDISTTINPSTGIVHRSYSERPISSSTAPIGPNWGKWGAIAGIAAIPVAVILWWYT